MERVKYFQNFVDYAREIKMALAGILGDYRVYVFGSVVRNDYSPGLSDIDIAIVSDEFENRKKKLEVYDLLFERFFDTPFEFHLLTRKRWKFYLNFIGNEYVEI